MQHDPDYVRNFEEQLSHRIRKKHPERIDYPDDVRVHDRPRKLRLEPPSQIQQQSILSAQTYAYLLSSLEQGRVDPIYETANKFVNLASERQKVS